MTAFPARAQEIPKKPIGDGDNKEGLHQEVSGDGISEGINFPDMETREKKTKII